MKNRVVHIVLEWTFIDLEPGVLPEVLIVTMIIHDLAPMKYTIIYTP